MYSSTVNSNLWRLMLPTVSLLVMGFLLRGLEPLVRAPVRWHGEQLTALVGQGGFFAVLGGLRSAVSSGFWLRAHQAWEQHDGVAMEALIGLTVAADERPVYFWLNGARMLAHDVPAWLPATTPVAVRRRAIDDQAWRALRLLERGLRWHGAEAGLYVEMANIHLHRLGDRRVTGWQRTSPGPRISRPASMPSCCGSLGTPEKHSLGCASFCRPCPLTTQVRGGKSFWSGFKHLRENWPRIDDRSAGDC